MYFRMLVKEGNDIWDEEPEIEKPKAMYRAIKKMSLISFAFGEDICLPTLHTMAAKYERKSWALLRGRDSRLEWSVWPQKSRYYGENMCAIRKAIQMISYRKVCLHYFLFRCQGRSLRTAMQIARNLRAWTEVVVID